MMNRKLRRLGGLFTMLVLLACLLTVSAFAGENEEWGYQQLAGDQKLAYRRIEAAVAERNTVADLTGCQISTAEEQRDQLTEVLRMLVADHPEYYWFLGEYTGGTGMGGYFKDLYLGYDFTYNSYCCESCEFYDPDAIMCEHPHCKFQTENPGKTGENQKIFNDAVTELLKDCPNGPAYEKALYIHDKLSNHITYDYDYQHEQSAYSAIVERKAVCAGYARAYQYLLNRVGIDAWTVEGFGWNPQGKLESHAWNLVWIDGKCVYTDVTWDDQTDDTDQIFYAYFNRSLDEISKDHMTDSEYVGGWTDYFGDKLPRNCSHEEESYFAANNINEIPGISVETLATNIRGTGEAYLIHVLYDHHDPADFNEWLDANLNALIEGAGIKTYGSLTIEQSSIGDELRIVIKMSSYEEPQPELVGYINEVTAKGSMTAYVNYKTSGLDSNEDYETVMVAYYDENDALMEVAFTELALDSAGRAELTADCPTDFAYCRVFVVGSDSNPAPLCNLLEMSAPASR